MSMYNLFAVIFQLTSTYVRLLEEKHKTHQHYCSAQFVKKSRNEVIVQFS